MIYHIQQAIEHDLATQYIVVAHPGMSLVYIGTQRHAALMHIYSFTSMVYLDISAKVSYLLLYQQQYKVSQGTSLQIINIIN